MRNAIYSAFLLACVSAVALAQTNANAAPEPPNTPAPAASDTYEAREAWCLLYAAWFVSEIQAEQSSPADARPTQRLENEVTYCKLDPQQYQRETHAESTQAAEAREEASAG